MWRDLSQPFHEEMPHSVALPAPEFETVSTISEDSSHVTYYSAPTHVGTHVDAPRHFVKDGETIDELALNRFAGEAIVLDVGTDEPREITADDLAAASSEVRDGDILLLSTGWEDRYGDPSYDPHPWLSVDAAEKIVDWNVSLVGMDVITPDLPGPYRDDDYDKFPVHQTLLGNDVLVAEHLANLRRLRGHRVEVVGFPHKIRDGDGAPARFVARVDEDELESGSTG